MGQMSKSLADAIELAKSLPTEEQDALAAILVAEMEAEAKWRKSLAKPGGTLSELAKAALDEHRAGKTRPMRVRDRS